MNKHVWCVDQVTQPTDKKQRRYNGRFDVLYRMPYFWCCKIRGENGFVPEELPNEFRADPIFKASKGVTISREKFIDVQQSILGHPRFVDYSPDQLKRGYGFLPVKFDPPSEKSDFAWCTGGAYMVLAERIHDIIRWYARDEFVSWELSSGYWIVVPKFHCLPPIERRGGVACPLCGFHANERNESKFIFENDMMIEQGIFSIGSTLYVVISDEIKEKIDALNPSNVVFRKVEIGGLIST